MSSRKQTFKQCKKAIRRAATEGLIDLDEATEIIDGIERFISHTDQHALDRLDHRLRDASKEIKDELKAISN